MTLRVWSSRDADFERKFSSLRRMLSLEEGLRAAGETEEKAPIETVRSILRQVREDGDRALLELTERLDGCRLEPGQLRVKPGEIQEAVERCAPAYLEAVRLAARRIEAFQRRALLPDPEPLVSGGRTLAVRSVPVDSAGLCVPGSAASLASSVLMTAVPAKVAGVARLVMVTPPQADGTISEDRLAAAEVAGVDEIYRAGGAQAVAALAYGTETIEPVDFVAGPGNIYVTLAKKEVFGRVGIEMLPGPSEVVIIADGSADPRSLAADLLAQAEHDPGSAVLLTTERETADGTRREVNRQLSHLANADAARVCLEQYGAAVLCRSMEECVDLTNRLAPEHLQVMTRDPERTMAGIRHAGAIFLGPWSPVAVGDYVAGPSHVLPTGTTARFSSGLSANDFRKRSSVIRYDRNALAEDGQSLRELAGAEGLQGHARSVEVREKG